MKPMKKYSSAAFSVLSFLFVVGLSCITEQLQAQGYRYFDADTIFIDFPSAQQEQFDIIVKLRYYGPEGLTITKAFVGDPHKILSYPKNALLFGAVYDFEFQFNGRIRKETFESAFGVSFSDFNSQNLPIVAKQKE